MNPTSDTEGGASDSDRFTNLFAAHYGSMLAFARRWRTAKRRKR